MKVLSLLQPWATLVVISAKKIETRKWQTKHRGELLIHASGGKAGELLCQEEPFTRYIDSFKELPFGAIIGKVTLEDIKPISQIAIPESTLNTLTLEERAFGDYSPGRFAWLLSDPVRFTKPLPVKGSLSLWEFDLPTSIFLQTHFYTRCRHDQVERKRK
jgi:hypothetical protein